MNIKQLVSKLSVFPKEVEVKIEGEDGNLYGIQRIYREEGDEVVTIVPFENEEETSNSEDEDNE